MPQIKQKYFIAIVPEGELQDNATNLKLQLKEKFNLKYALRSPAHVTLKMPFLWNEAKEDQLVLRLSAFFQEQPIFKLKFKGIGKFGNRVIYIKVDHGEELTQLQSGLSRLCKTQLNLTEELSDYAYHPHMTLAFRDVKKAFFLDYLAFLRAKGFNARMQVTHVALLKFNEGRWKVVSRCPLALLPR